MTLTRVFFCKYSKSFGNNLFYRTTAVTAFELFLVSERIFKKESGEIAFDLISLFHIQIQEPTRSSTTTTAFVFPAKFHYQKIFETRNWWGPKHLCGWT